MKEVLFFNKRATFSVKMVYKRVRGWTFVKYSPPLPGLFTNKNVKGRFSVYNFFSPYTLFCIGILFPDEAEYFRLKIFL